MYRLNVQTAGESHGTALLGIISGLPAGLAINPELINRELVRRRQGYGRGPRMNMERDRVQILSGVRNGHTTGAPVALQLENQGRENSGASAEGGSEGSSDPLTTPRPGHADFAGMIKYDLDDARDVLESASARETAMRVAVGAVCKQLLDHFSISIGSRVRIIGTLRDTTPLPDSITGTGLNELSDSSPVRCLDAKISDALCRTIDEAQAQGDTLGGSFEVLATGLPIGLGSYVKPMERLDSRLSAQVMSIPGVKGVHIGAIEKQFLSSGSRAHDEMRFEQGRFQRISNLAGGIEGGVSNGSPLVLGGLVKPVPTLSKPRQSIDLIARQNAPAFRQRHDTCVVPAVGVIAESMVALLLADELLHKFGGDSVAQTRAHFQATARFPESL